MPMALAAPAAILLFCPGPRHPGIYAFALGAAAAVGLPGLLMIFAVSRALKRRTQHLVAGVQRCAAGDFAAPLETPRPSEMAVPAASRNDRAADIDQRLRAVTQERNQQEAVLSSMAEGVLAVDNEGRIMIFNKAACLLAGAEFERQPGAFLRDAAPDSPVSEFMARMLAGAGPLEDEFESPGRGGRIVQASGSVLRDARGDAIGAVVVLNDVTRLRRLERVRRDFVANVSHELRTPITSIKGFVETLLDGAMEDPADAKRFLEILAKQADRLNALLGDLLTLSGIEEEAETAGITLELLAIRDTLEASLHLCAEKARAKHIRVLLDCPEGLSARIHPSLLEQAVVNLIDNAVKYSPEGSTVQVRALCRDGAVIQVEDHGCGVSQEHLPRLFERFYRVDKARSRSLGGTGLGLAIVKHVITAHGGRVAVETTPGAGSTFSLILPAP